MGSLYAKGRQSVLVGNALYHTVGDRERALAQLHTDFLSLQTEIMKKAGWSADPYHAAEGPIWEWWQTVGVPVMDEWQKFYTAQMGSWSARWATDWSEYERWQDRLRMLRDAARGTGMTLDTPDPQDLPTTIWKDVGEGTKKTLKAATYAVLIAAGVGGLILIRPLFKSGRKGESQ